MPVERCGAAVVAATVRASLSRSEPESVSASLSASAISGKMAASHREVWPLDGSFRHPDGMIVPSGSQGHAIEGTFARRWDVNREVAHPPVGPADGVTNGRIHLSDGQRFGEATVLPSVTATGLALGVPTARCYRFEVESRPSTNQEY